MKSLLLLSCFASILSACHLSHADDLAAEVAAVVEEASKADLEADKLVGLSIAVGKGEENREQANIRILKTQDASNE